MFKRFLSLCLALMVCLLYVGTASATGINVQARIGGGNCGGVAVAGGGGVTYAPSFAPGGGCGVGQQALFMQSALYGQQFYPPVQAIAPFYVPRQAAFVPSYAPQLNVFRAPVFRAPVYGVPAAGILVPRQRGINFNLSIGRQPVFVPAGAFGY